MAVINGTAAPDILNGTGFADTMFGLAGDDILYGFDGNDSLIGGFGDDTLIGGSGADTMDGGAGEDFFYGGSGIDLVSFVNSGAQVVLNLSDALASQGDAAGDFFFSVERFALTDFNDGFVGSTRGDVATGGLGNDTLDGGGGVDTLSGGDGKDVLIGGQGGDALDGGNGFDIASYAAGGVITFNGAVGTGDMAGDLLTGIEGLRMSAFGDLVTLSGALTYLEGGAGNDSLTGAALAETIYGGDGADTLLGMGGSDVIYAGNAPVPGPQIGADSLDGGGGNDTLFGGTGGEFLFGGTGADVLRGKAGDDTMIGGTGADVLDGGDGVDGVIYSNAVTLNLLNAALGSGEAKGDVLSNIEQVRFAGGGVESSYIGGTQSLTIFAGPQTAVHATAGSGAERFEDVADLSYVAASGAVTLVGSGPNELSGSGGAAGDVFVGVGAKLVLTGFADVLDLRSSAISTVQVTLAGGNDAVTLAFQSFVGLTMGDGADTVTGTTSHLRADMGDGNDVADVDPLTSQLGDASIDGGLGNDQITIGGLQSETLVGGQGDDTISVTNGMVGNFVTVEVDGGTGADSLTASVAGGSLHILGGDGADVIIASDADGQMNLDAGSGNDSVTGSAFFGQFQGGDGNDTMTITAHAIESGTFEVDGGAGADVITMTLDAPLSVGSVRVVDVVGGSGNDTVHGDTNFSAITAEAFVFGTGWGNDVLTGFDLLDDKLVFDGIGGLTQAADFTSISGNASHTVLTFGTDSVDITGLNFADFSADLLTFT